MSIHHRLRIVMIATPLFFMIRVPMIVLTQIFTSWRGLWWFDPLYFTVLEFTPLMMLIGVLKMSRRADISVDSGANRLSGGYRRF
jgi:hypothetical protein